jgi:thiol-disulfide isomerase/thioredoxin
VLAHWKHLSETFRSQALFAYIVGNAIPDVLEYFSIDEQKDLPIIIAHDPARDYKYISRPRLLELSQTDQQDFVAGVLSGKTPRVMKSEAIPRARKKTSSSSSHVVKLVGKTVVEAVSQTGVDVLLEIHTPYCAQCKRLMPTIDILAKAVAAENRILITKIDGHANDLPSSWNIKTYPTLLWFPAKDKPYSGDPSPRPYWDAGQSLVELISFLQRQGSFDSKSLKIATSEQLSSLLSEEDVLRKKYEVEEVKERRNEGRDYYDNEILDYILGEIVFDGKRWHFGLVIALVIVVLVQLGYSVVASKPTGQKIKKKVT